MEETLSLLNVAKFVMKYLVAFGISPEANPSYSGCLHILACLICLVLVMDAGYYSAGSLFIYLFIFTQVKEKTHTLNVWLNIHKLLI